MSTLIVKERVKDDMDYRLSIRKKNILLCFLGMLGILFTSYGHAAGPYDYPQKEDYAYDLGSIADAQWKLQIDQGSVQLPKLTEDNSTFILGAKVECNASDTHPKTAWFQVGKSRSKHTLEPACKGMRYFNLSSLHIQGEQILQFQGEGVKLSDSSVTLFRFAPVDLAGKRIMIIAPHPDDAEIAAYGLYSRYPEKSYIVTVTVGDAGPKNYDEIYSDTKEHYFEKAKLRLHDSLTIPLLGGIPPSRCVNLGFYDGTLSTMATHQNRIVKPRYGHRGNIAYFRSLNLSPLATHLHGQARWRTLFENYVSLLRAIRPEIIIAPYPALDKHPDHHFSTVALLEAIAATGLQKGELLLYSNHYILSESFPFGHHGDPVDLPPYFGKPFYIDGIFALHIGKKVQKEKIFALEANHDLRPDLEWYFKPKKYMKEVCNNKHRFWMWHGQNASYFRRAVRAEELFFVIKMAEVGRMRNPYANPVIKRLINGH